MSSGGWRNSEAAGFGFLLLIHMPTRKYIGYMKKFFPSLHVCARAVNQLDTS
jgi:hypothetical protein